MQAALLVLEQYWFLGENLVLEQVLVFGSEFLNCAYFTHSW